MPHKDDMEHKDSIVIPNNKSQGVHKSDMIMSFPPNFVVSDMLIPFIEEDQQHKGESEKNDKIVGNLNFASTQRETLESNSLASANDDKSLSKHTIYNNFIPIFTPLNFSFEDYCKPTSNFSQSISIIMKTPLLVHHVRWRVMEISLWTFQHTMALQYITSFLLISYLVITI